MKPAKAALTASLLIIAAGSAISCSSGGCSAEGSAGSTSLGSPGAVSAPRADANEQVVRLEDVPAAVRAAIEQQLNGATIDEIERSTDKNGVTVFEVDAERDGHDFEFTLAEDGTLLTAGSGQNQGAAVGDDDDGPDDDEDGDEDEDEDEDEDGDEDEDEDGDDDGPDDDEDEDEDGPGDDRGSRRR